MSADDPGGSHRPGRTQSRFRAVATVGLVCAVLLGAVVVGLTGSLALGAAVGVSVAVLLVGLGVVGVRQGEAHPAAMAAHEARRRRLTRIIEPDETPDR